MHHPDFSESPTSRRMSNPSVFAGRRGSNPGGGAAVQTDEHQVSGMVPHMAPAGSSSPGPHHPPHTLSIHPQGQNVGAQVKKKSGFQITSVLPAQVSASGNNSIADDTESYDDMDESHTEDLSSSDILDVSVSRATDTGIPERSSSEETLNSLHGGETPGVTSPNEPVMHHPQQGYMVNGVHHHHHHQSHQPHGHHKAAQGRPAVGVGPATIAPVPSGPSAQGKITSGHSVQAAVMEGGGPAAVSHPTALPPVAGVAPDVATGPTERGPAVAPLQPLPAFPTVTQTQTNAASTASRFRVVKLDSNSEPFRKGRWTCTEYYEKDAPPGDPAAAHRTVENIIHSEHETTSGSSSGSTLSGGGDAPQTYPVHTGPPPQIQVHPQDAGTHSVLHPSVVSSMNPQAVTVTGMLASDNSSAPVRLQQPVPYAVEGQIPPGQSSYHPNAKPPMSVSQCGMQSMEYTQIAPNIQPAAPPHQIASIQTAVSPRAAQVPVGIPGLTAAPVVVPQPVSPRPQAPAPQLGMPQTTSVTAAQLHPDPQQTGAQLSLSGPPGSSMPPSAAQSSMQPAAQSMLHGAAVQGLHSGPPEGRAPPAVASYGGISAVTASQLEDAQRLLLQHHPFLSLPRLAAGAAAGLAGRTAADVGAALGQETSADVSAAADEDSSSGASVVAIDNKIEQAMDLVKSHLMYAVREEVEVLKEQIKELIERNSQLEQENTLLKNLASPEQLAQFQAEVQAGSPSSGPHTGPLGAPAALPSNQGPGPTA